MSHQTCCRKGQPAAHEDSHRTGLLDVMRFVVIGVSIVLVWLHVFSATGEKLFGLAALAFGGYPLFKESILALLQKRMSMELSMAIALCAALFTGEVSTALVIVLFVLIAEELERRTVAGGRRSISSLLELLPKTAMVKRGDKFQELPVGNLVKGDIVMITPGSRIVVDGSVTAGHSFVDESAITGESVPAEKTAGSAVFAGAINQSGALEVVADRVGKDTTFGKIIEAIEKSDSSRAPVQRLADKLAGYIVTVALLAASVTFFLTGSLTEAISVILVAGACGVAAGTPLAVLGAIARSAKRGIIVKGGLYLERLAQVDTVAFDKTGTLTSGVPRVVNVIAQPGETLESVLKAAATADHASQHPLAKAILKRAAESRVQRDVLTTFAYLPGRGIVCSTEADQIVIGNRALMTDQAVLDLPEAHDRSMAVTEVLVSRNGRFIGTIQIADSIRAESKQLVADLHELGIRTVMLTGDADPVARAVAAELGIDDVFADLRPEDKCRVVRNLAVHGRRVAVVGDGINDAPALREASVGIAIGGGSDVALESAEIVIMSSNLSRLADTVRIARQCRRVILFNFVGTIAVDVLGMLCAALGMLNPLGAALVHVLSELAFIANSARLFPVFNSIFQWRSSETKT